jgi:tetratricopeptide (TPR) repeat protein
LRAEIYHDTGDETAARRYYELARREMIDSLRSRPNDGSIHASLALAYAGLGRKQEAVREIETALNLTPLSRDAGSATAFMGNAVEVFGRVGELDRAFEKIELLLTMNSGRDLPLTLVEVWPGFAPIRKDPRYAEIVQRFGGK